MTDAAKIGTAAIENLLDRRGIRQALSPIKYNDPEIWEEIVRVTGEAAIEAMQPEHEYICPHCGIRKNAPKEAAKNNF